MQLSFLFSALVLLYDGLFPSPTKDKLTDTKTTNHIDRNEREKKEKEYRSSSPEAGETAIKGGAKGFGDERVGKWSNGHSCDKEKR